MLDQIERAVCLVLDKRYDMWLKLKEEAKRHGIQLEPYIAGSGEMNLEYDYLDRNQLPVSYPLSTYYSTWWKYPHALNAWMCHFNIIERAYLDNISTLLIMEDDAQFEADFHEVLEDVTPFFNNNKWDMLYLGAYHNPQTITHIDGYVSKVLGCAGWHAVILQKPIIDIIVKKFIPLGPMDWMTGRWLHPTYKCYAVFPSIITQKSGYSYIEEGNLEKPARDKI